MGKRWAYWITINLYGKPSGTYYYVDGLLQVLKQMNIQLNEAEVCLVRLHLNRGTVIIAVAVDDFLDTASSEETMEEFYRVMETKYNIKRLGRPKTCLGWHFHYGADGGIAISEHLLIGKTLQDDDVMNANGRQTPYLPNIEYLPPTPDETFVVDTKQKYKQLVGDFRYIADCTRPEISYFVGRPGAALTTPTTRYWRILKAALKYIAKTRNYGLYILQEKKDRRQKPRGVVQDTHHHGDFGRRLGKRQNRQKVSYGWMDDVPRNASGVDVAQTKLSCDVNSRSSVQSNGRGHSAGDIRANINSNVYENASINIAGERKHACIGHYKSTRRNQTI